MQKSEISKNCHFLQVRGHKIFNVFGVFFLFLLLFWKDFENEGKHQYLKSDQLKCKNSLLWRQNIHKCEISKHCHFAEIRGHRKLFFSFFGKPLEMKQNINT